MKISLKQLILLVALLSVILTLFSSISSGYRVDRETLVRNTLETNRVYAQKLANTTDMVLNATLQILQESSKQIAIHINHDDLEEKLLREAERLKNQTNMFNSVVVASADGIVLATSPQTLDIIGKLIDSLGGQQSLKARTPYISKPYISITGRMIIFISHPIFDQAGNYFGLVGGTLYLQETNLLHEILGEHFYQDGSHVYVIDGDGRIIYHQNPERINDVVPENSVVQQLMQGNSGSARLVNSRNINMLAGYAYIPASGWGVVSQRPLDATILPSKDMMKEMIVKSIPLLLLSLFTIWLISTRIALPLQKLAQYTELSIKTNQDESIGKVSAWYYEAIQLKKALVHSLGFFHERVNYFIHQSTTDPLTNLMNRRTLDEQLKIWSESEIPYSVILLDIDRFKHVNDTYGHSVGDDVLIFLANQIREVSRKGDICCRYGGEEFLLILPNTNHREAYQVAERLRSKMNSQVSPCGDIVTISAGIASYPECATHPAELIQKADQCLYEAKRSGRNRCVLFKKAS